MAKEKKIILKLLLFFMFMTITRPAFSTSCDQSTGNRSMAIPVPHLLSMHDCATSTDCAIACFEAAIAQARTYPGAFDIHALVEYCFLNYQLQTGKVNGLGLINSARFDNTDEDECFTSTVTSGNQSTMDRPIGQHGGRKLMREVARTPSTPSADFGRTAPNWNSTTEKFLETLSS